MSTRHAPAEGGVGDVLVARWPAARPFLVVGSVAIVAGGIVTAVTRPTGFELGSWVAAYLVLVAGVAQIALGVGQAWMAPVPPRPSAVRVEVAWWNLGVVATIVGSLFQAPVLTTLGGAASVVALCLFLRGVQPGGSTFRWARRLYGGVIAIVLISTPIGLALAWTRHG